MSRQNEATVHMKKGRYVKKAMMLMVVGGLVQSSAAIATDQTYSISTGDDLRHVCADASGTTLSAADKQRLMVCGAYIRGYLGHYSVARSLMRHEESCLPQKGVSAEKVRQLYVAVLEKRPQLRDFPAAVDLASILKAAYPCKNGNSP